MLISNAYRIDGSRLLVDTQVVIIGVLHFIEVYYTMMLLIVAESVAFTCFFGLADRVHLTFLITQTYRMV